MADGPRLHCVCAQCRVCGLLGPLMLITVGALFLVAQYTRFSFADLWPILLIVAGGVLYSASVVSGRRNRSSCPRLCENPGSQTARSKIFSISSV